MISWQDLMQYLSVFGMIIATGFGLPLPEEVPIITGGIMTGRAANDPNSDIVWWIMLPVCMLAVVIGDALLYAVGWKYGPKLLEKDWVKKKLITPEKRVRIERNFHKYGLGVLLVARLLPGIRAPIFMMAGVIRLPFSRFLLADGIYAIPGVSALFWLSYWFTDSFMAVFHEVDRYRNLVVTTILAGILGAVLYSLLIRRKVSTGDPDSLPIFGQEVAKIGDVIGHLHHDDPIAETTASPGANIERTVDPSVDSSEPKPTS